MSQYARKVTAEAVGTFLLVFLAVGSAIFGIAAKVGVEGNGPGNGIVGVALAFGLVLLGIAYAFLAMLVGRRMPAKEAVGYWVAQFVGAILAAGILKLFVSSLGATDYTGGLGTNSYDNGAIGMAGAFLLEVLLTGAFVLVILLVTERVAAPGFAGLAIGLTLTLVHLVGIPLDGTSVNPARSFGPALFAGGDALGQVWLFILAPLVGSLVAVALWKLTRTTDAETEALVAGSERE